MKLTAVFVFALLASASADRPLPVGIEMRNVRLHVAADAALDVRFLSGALNSVSALPPVFDDQQSFTMTITDGEIAVDAASLTALVNRAFDYKGSALSDLQLTFEGGHLVQRGTLKKGVKVPFSIVADVSATAEGQMHVHPLKVKTAGVPTTKLMALFGVELADILKGRPDRGFTFNGNELFLDPGRMLPAPSTRGKLAKAFVRGDHLVEVFGRGVLDAKATGNYIWFHGGTIRFGRLTMADADLKLVDMDPRDPFDFYSARYNEQLVAGYSKNTPDHALRTYMPDYDDLKKKRRP